MPLPLNKTNTASLHLSLFLVVALLSGCTSTPYKDPAVIALNIREMPMAAQSPAIALQVEHSPDVRLGRYTKASTSPRPDQLDLLSQVVNIQIPQSLTPTVQNALTYVLRYSGYSLCPATSELRQLYVHPLPASHYRLGPITLRNALVTLAGSAWQPTVDEKARRICFVSQMAPAIPARLISNPERSLTEMKQ
jgi:type IV pili sensor histidine kinase/response regulator